MKIFSKKGDVDILEHIPYILLTIIVIFGFYALISSFAKTNIDVKPIQANVLLYRLVYEPEGLSYTVKNDFGSSQVNIGVVDDDFFTSERLTKFLSYDYDRQIAAKLVLVDIETDQILKTAYYNEELYKNTEPLASALLKGLGSATMYKKTFLVSYQKSNLLFPADLEISIIVPH